MLQLSDLCRSITNDTAILVTEWIVSTDLVLLKMLRWCHYFLKTLEFPYTFIPLEQKKSQLQNSKKINSNVEVMLSYST